MNTEFWLGVISRISVPEPIDLDPILAGPTAIMGPNPDLAPGAAFSPSVVLWKRNEIGQSYIGVRVEVKPSDCTHAAIRLAAAALERNVVPIILTTLDNCGFERFGFRVERILGDKPEDRKIFADELKNFWDIAIEIDISDVAALS